MQLRMGCLVLICALVGCSGGPAGPTPPPTVPVKGKVTMDGKPFGNAIVTFVPTGSTKGIGSSGETDAQGNYTLRTYSGGKDATPGAPVGNYKVIVSKFVTPDGKEVPADSKEPPANLGATESMPPHYSDPGQTVLEFAVAEKGGEINIELSSAAPGAAGPGGGGAMPR